MAGPRLGVTFRPQLPPDRLRDVARAAEAAGFDELWLWEDCFLEGGLTSATAALAWTERLHVGVGLLPVPLRNPALAAMEIATVAALFPGRFLPGVGHGIQDWMAQAGARPASPMSLLRDHTTAVRRLLDGDTVDADTAYTRLDRVRLAWPPAVVPPLLMGGRGPRTLALAGEIADGIVLDSGLSTAAVQDAVGVFSGARELAGHQGPGVVVVYREILDVRPERVRQVVEETAAAGATSVVLEPGADAPDPAELMRAAAPLLG